MPISNIAKRYLFKRLINFIIQFNYSMAISSQQKWECNNNRWGRHPIHNINNNLCSNRPPITMVIQVEWCPNHSRMERRRNSILLRPNINGCNSTNNKFLILPNRLHKEIPHERQPHSFISSRLLPLFLTKPQRHNIYCHDIYIFFFIFLVLHTLICMFYDFYFNFFLYYLSLIMIIYIFKYY